MEIILLKDVDKLGTEGDVVRVKPGFARNFLLPMGLAVSATPKERKAVEEVKRQRQRKADRAKVQAEALKRKLEGKSLTLKLTLGMDDKPFGSITANDIVQSLKQDGLAIEKHTVHLESPIKTLGIFEVPVRVHHDVTAKLKLWVVKA